MKRPQETYEARIESLEREVQRMRRLLLTGACIAALVGLSTCDKSGFSSSDNTEQTGLLVAKEVRVGDEQANVKLAQGELRLTTSNGSLVLQPGGIRFFQKNGQEIGSLSPTADNQHLVVHDAAPKKETGP